MTEVILKDKLTFVLPKKLGGKNILIKRTAVYVCTPYTYTYLYIPYIVYIPYIRVYTSWYIKKKAKYRVVAKMHTLYEWR